MERLELPSLQTKRVSALKWWNSLTIEDKWKYTLPGRNQSSLTGREIQGIWEALAQPDPTIKYKVIADYPSSTWGIGCVLEYNELKREYAMKYGTDPFTVWSPFGIREPDKYPAIFEKVN